MKQPDIIKAYKTIQKYENERLPMKISYALHKTRVLLQTQWDFQAEREQALIEKYQPEFTKDGMQFKDEDTAKQFAAEFQKELNEMAELDVDLGSFNKPTVPLSDDVQLTVDDIATLEPFIEFV